ncbi:hypothetical protein BJ742DRAFT_774357 [Cladochytrium replicatum]|nr:hypothetical protein BJ742DRAFT_774357 [Cladochytrium replicatum]
MSTAELSSAPDSSELEPSVSVVARTRPHGKAPATDTTTNTVSICVALPKDILETVFLLLDDPVPFSRTCRTAWQVSRDPVVRARWIWKDPASSLGTSLEFLRVKDGCMPGTLLDEPTSNVLASILLRHRAQIKWRAEARARALLENDERAAMLRQMSKRERGKKVSGGGVKKSVKGNDAEEEVSGGSGSGETQAIEIVAEEVLHFEGGQTAEDASSVEHNGNDNQAADSDNTAAEEADDTDNNNPSPDSPISVLPPLPNISPTIPVHSPAIEVIFDRNSVADIDKILVMLWSWVTHKGYISPVKNMLDPQRYYHPSVLRPSTTSSSSKSTRMSSDTWEPVPMAWIGTGMANAVRGGHLPLARTLYEMQASVGTLGRGWDHGGRGLMLEGAESGSVEMMTFLIGSGIFAEESEKVTKAPKKPARGSAAAAAANATAASAEMASAAADITVAPVAEDTEGGEVAQPVRSVTAQPKLSAMGYTRLSEALHVAAMSGHRDMVKYILSEGGSYPAMLPAVRSVAKKADIGLLRFFLSECREIEAKSWSDEGGPPTAHTVTKGGDVAMQAAALTVASEHGHIELVKYVLDLAATTQTFYNGFFQSAGVDALRLAAREGHMDVLLLLVDRGPQDREGAPYDEPLMFAAGRGDLKMAKVLIKLIAGQRKSDEEKKRKAEVERREEAREKRSEEEESARENGEAGTPSDSNVVGDEAQAASNRASVVNEGADDEFDGVAVLLESSPEIVVEGETEGADNDNSNSTPEEPEEDQEVDESLIWRAGSVAVSRALSIGRLDIVVELVRAGADWREALESSNGSYFMGSDRAIVVKLLERAELEARRPTEQTKESSAAQPSPSQSPSFGFTFNAPSLQPPYTPSPSTSPANNSLLKAYRESMFSQDLSPHALKSYRTSSPSPSTLPDSKDADTHKPLLDEDGTLLYVGAAHPKLFLKATWLIEKPNPNLLAPPSMQRDESGMSRSPEFKFSFGSSESTTQASPGSPGLLSPPRAAPRASPRLGSGSPRLGASPKPRAGRGFHGGSSPAKVSGGSWTPGVPDGLGIKVNSGPSLLFSGATVQKSETEEVSTSNPPTMEFTASNSSATSSSAETVVADNTAEEPDETEQAGAHVDDDDGDSDVSSTHTVQGMSDWLSQMWKGISSKLTPTSAPSEGNAHRTVGAGKDDGLGIPKVAGTSWRNWLGHVFMK